MAPTFVPVLNQPVARARSFTGYHSATALIAAARQAGCSTVVDGLEVLVRQGAASFEQWTGIEAPIDVMRSAIRPEG